MGDNAYKLQLLRDVAILDTFYTRDLSPYVEDCFEDPLDLMSNPFQEWEVDVEEDILESSLNPNKV